MSSYLKAVELANSGSKELPLKTGRAWDLAVMLAEYIQGRNDPSDPDSWDAEDYSDWARDVKEDFKRKEFTMTLDQAVVDWYMAVEPKNIPTWVAKLIAAYRASYKPSKPLSKKKKAEKKKAEKSGYRGPPQIDMLIKIYNKWLSVAQNIVDNVGGARNSQKTADQAKHFSEQFFEVLEDGMIKGKKRDLYEWYKDNTSAEDMVHMFIDQMRNRRKNPEKSSLQLLTARIVRKAK